MLLLSSPELLWLCTVEALPYTLDTNGSSPSVTCLETGFWSHSIPHCNIGNELIYIDGITSNLAEILNKLVNSSTIISLFQTFTVYSPCRKFNKFCHL